MSEPITAPTDFLRDVDQLNAVDVPEQASPISVRPSGFHVASRRSVLAEIECHGRSTSDREVCGVLVGRLCRDSEGPYLLVEGSIRGEHAANMAAQVTFTSETWTHIHEVIARRFPTESIVGWYHTHPGFGIFLSEMDRFIHDNFFGLPWQVAYVYDPLNDDDGLFLWRNGIPVRSSFEVVEDEPAVPDCSSSPDEAAPPETPLRTVSCPSDLKPVFSSRMCLLAAAIGVAALVLIALAIATWPFFHPVESLETISIENTSGGAPP